MTSTTTPTPRGLRATSSETATAAPPRAARAPKGLGTEGRRLWRDLTGAYDFESYELALLVMSCRTLDRLQDIAEGLEGAP